MIVVILFVFIKICVSAPIDTCSLAGATINDETWSPFVKKIVNCIEHAVSIRDQERYNFLISLATELSEVSYYNGETTKDNILPLNIPMGLHNRMKEILKKHLRKGNEIVKDPYRVSVVEISRVCPPGNRFNNTFALVILSGLLALSAFLALMEIYSSWKKYVGGQRVRNIVRRPRVYTLRQSLNGQGDGIYK